jgi:hypothetical protein
MTTPARRRPPRRQRRRSALLRWAAGLLAVAAVFAVGVAVGEALDDNSQPGRSQILVRTLVPLELAPARETVTVRR